MQTALFRLTAPAGSSIMFDLAGLRALANSIFPGTVTIEPDPANTIAYNAWTLEFPTAFQPDTTGAAVGFDADGTPQIPDSLLQVPGLLDADGNPTSLTVECLRRNIWEPTE